MFMNKFTLKIGRFIIIVILTNLITRSKIKYGLYI